MLIVDEAQEMLTNVFTELRLLASKELDARAMLCIIFAGDARLPERFRSEELLPLGSRIRRNDGAHTEDLAANTLLFAADQLAFALVRYRVEHAISPR